MHESILTFCSGLGAVLVVLLIQGHQTFPRCPAPSPSSVEELFAPCQALAADVEKGKAIARYNRAKGQVAAYLQH
jgi:hypothetical protein